MSLTTLPRTLTFGALAFAISAIVAPQAQAVTLYAKFYAGGQPGNGTYSGPYSGAGTVYNATKGLATDCPAVGSCSSDNIATSESFKSGAITATVNVAPGNKVWDDISPRFGGLGVGTGTPSNEDQIAGTDILNVTFSAIVKLTGVATLFDSGHTPFGPGFSSAPSGAALNTIAFLLSVDGGAFNPITFLAANTLNTLGLTGTSFRFEQKTGSPEFYVSALAYESCGPGGAGCAPPPPGTPIPGTLPLFGTGLGLLGTLIYRRKRKSAAV
jgi:hypothetical protein